MVIFSGLFSALARLFGAVATRTMGWATILLFGRVPQSRQTLLAYMALASLGWLLAVAAVIVPAVGDLVVATVPRPPQVDASWVRPALVAAAVLLPATVGLATAALAPAEERKGPVAILAHVLRGYPYTAVFALTIVFLGAWGLLRNMHALGRQWQSVHVPMIVKPGRYEAVVDDLAEALAEAGLRLERKLASRWFVVPPRLLAAVGGTGVRGLIPDRLVAFRCDDLGILIYPSDVALLGRKELVARARAAIARRVAFADAYLTTGQESERIEDRLRELARRPLLRSADFAPIDAEIDELVVPYDEWETLFRLRLQVEHEAHVRERAHLGLTEDVA